MAGHELGPNPNPSILLSHDVQIAAAYPVRDPSGFSPIILAHDHGVTIRWINDNETQNQKQPQTSHGSSFDYSLDTQILDLAIPPIDTLLTDQSSSDYWEYFTNNIIFAVACADSTIKLVSIPASHSTVPKTGTTRSSATILAELHHPQNLPGLISIIWTVRSSGHARDTSDSMDSSPLSLLVASASKEANSFLSITRVPIHISNGVLSSRAVKIPFQRVLLPTQPIRLSFNTASNQSPYHCQILVAGCQGHVYVYDPFQTRSDTLALTRTSTSPSEDPERGSWLASFTTRFISSTDDANESVYLAQRKRILDAQWVANGQAIIALLSDGEWGIWDVHGAHPNKHAIYDFASFAIWGTVASSIPSHIPSDGQKKSFGSTSLLPAMTPNTRKIKADQLFGGSHVPSDSNSIGGLIVARVPLPSANNVEDSVTFWYRNSICFIESLQTYWSRAVRHAEETKLASTNGSILGPALTRIPGLDLGGKTITSVSQLPAMASTTSAIRTIAITTDRQIILSTRTVERGLLNGVSRAVTLPSRTQGHSKNDVRALIPVISDMSLSIDKMDLVLDKMQDAEDLSMSGGLTLTGAAY